MPADLVAALLAVTGQHRAGFRDHVLYSIALGTGLREHEIAALDVGDVFDGVRVARRIRLRVWKRPRRPELDDPERQIVALPDGTFYKLDKWIRIQPAPLELGRALFLSERGQRLSTRAIRHNLRTWQARAGIAPPFSFHHLRHTAIDLMRQRTRDLALVQRFARHSDIRTTGRYMHPSIDELTRAVREQPS